MNCLPRDIRHHAHSLLTELLVARYSVLGDFYKMLMLKIQPQKCHYRKNTCYFMDRNPATNRKFVQQDSGWQPVIPLTDCVHSTMLNSGMQASVLYSVINRICAIIRIWPLITDTQTNIKQTGNDSQVKRFKQESTDKWTDRRRDRHYQVHYLPAQHCCAVDKNVHRFNFLLVFFLYTDIFMFWTRFISYSNRQKGHVVTVVHV